MERVRSGPRDSPSRPLSEEPQSQRHIHEQLAMSAPALKLPLASLLPADGRIAPA